MARKTRHPGYADARTTRYRSAEHLYGQDAIAAFRTARSPLGLERSLHAM
jgi:hypothetical protein